MTTLLRLLIARLRRRVAAGSPVDVDGSGMQMDRKGMLVRTAGIDAGLMGIYGRPYTRIPSRGFGTRLLLINVVVNVSILKFLWICFAFKQKILFK